jgi:DNA primase
MNFEGRSLDVKSIITSLGLDIRAESGRELLLDCVFHDDGGRNLSVNSESGFYHCWVCSADNPQAKGTLVRLVSNVRGCTWQEATEYMVEHSGQLSPTELIRDIRLAFRKPRPKRHTEIKVSQYYNPSHTYWSKTRKIDFLTATEFLLGYDKKRNHAIIPITVDGMPVATIRRTMFNYGTRYVYTKGFDKNEVLFGLDHCKGNGLYVVEGAVDALKVHQAGYNGIAVLGSNLSKQQAKLIREYGPSYIVIMTDEDLGGQMLANQIAAFLPEQSLFYVTLPNKKKDPGSCTTFEIWEAIEHKKNVIGAWMDSYTGGWQPRESPY